MNIIRSARRRRLCALLLAVITAAVLSLPGFAAQKPLPGDSVTVELYGSELGGEAVKSICITPLSRSGKLRLTSIKAHGPDGAGIVSTDGGVLIAAFSSNTPLQSGLLLSCEFVADGLGEDEVFFDVRAKAAGADGEHDITLTEPEVRVFRIGCSEDYDVNGDGAVNAIDLVRLMRIIGGATTDGYADINDDGTVDTRDLVRLLHALAVGVG